jgi:GTP-sensing pleiotropic transcriptional regulator CodY
MYQNSGAGANFASAVVFKQLSDVIKSDASLVSKVGVVLAYRLSKGGNNAVWVVDLKVDKSFCQPSSTSLATSLSLAVDLSHIMMVEWSRMVLVQYTLVNQRVKLMLN